MFLLSKYNRMLFEIIKENYDIVLYLIGFGIIAVASNQISKLFQRIHLPLITGLIFIGILSGPYLIDLIPEGSIKQLSFINDIALSFIAFAAGSELYLNELRNRVESIKWMTIGQLIVSFILGALIVFLLSDYIPYMRNQNLVSNVSIAILTGAIFVARSPASAIAIINELRAKGPFTQTVMGVTVVKDFLVIILFGISMSISETLIIGRAFNLLAIVIILFELGLSFGLGFVIYWFIKLILSFKLEKRYKTIMILFVGFSVYQFAYLIRTLTGQTIHHEIFLEPLLICIMASFLITNYTRYRAEFIRIITDVGPMVYVAFFTLTGAAMRIDVLRQAWLVALLFFFIRLITIMIGAYFGGVMAKDPPSFNKVAWMPYVTQAGVALGLATIVANEFPSWGPEFSAIVISVIVINQFIGPPLFKWSLKYLGEDRTKGKSYEYDGIRDALIFGLESQSIALAHQLKENGWLARIVTLDEDKKNTQLNGIDLIYFDSLTIDNLNEIHAERTEVFVTLLTDEENYKICEMAYQYYGTNVLVVRLNQRENFEKFHKLGALIVEPSTAMVSLLDHFVRSPMATSLLLGMQQDQDTRDVEVLNPNMHGLFLRDLRLPPDVIILSIKRSGQMIISHGYTRLRLGDIVTLVGSIESLDNVARRFGS
jgi:Trk K+ transport system NAD-binding subunit/Kef-type K+ transport system membrane component KefB